MRRLLHDEHGVALRGLQLAVPSRVVMVVVVVVSLVQVRLNGLRSAEKQQALPQAAGLVPKLALAELEASSGSFPPCMSHLHHDLRATHKLKHEGRLVYTLFLKGAGMPLKEQLESETF